MRIIAGSLGSQSFDYPKGHRTHPMGDRIRTALFNTLGNIEGLSVLDVFGGSGAISYEAVSRGAKHSTILEIDRDAYDVIIKNIEKLGLKDQVKVIHINARSWTYRNNAERFDLVFCDPPYDNIQETTLEKMAKHVKAGGLLVYSLPTNGDIRLPSDKYELVSNKTYGNVMLAFYRKIS